MNAGQMIKDVKLAVNCDIPCEHLGHMGGMIPDPNEVVETAKKITEKP